MECDCKLEKHKTQLVVITGGPGAGKTAVLEAARRLFCQHVTVLPEAASMLFNGGFPRSIQSEGVQCVQRAIYHVQLELERQQLASSKAAIALCDRGTVDGMAYWPDSPSSFWEQVGSSQAKEFMRYKAVIHLRTPLSGHGYNLQNPARIETAEEAAILDQRIAEAWRGHHNYQVVESSSHFFEKMTLACNLIQREIPDCCGGSRRNGS